MDRTQTGIYEFSAPLPGGAIGSFEQYRGQVLLIVNTASKCGFTPQYEGLEQLYRTYHERGFQVLGFPCNQFGAQEPGSDQEIGAFCQKNFGVTFPIFEKIEVNGPRQLPLFDFLKRSQPGLLGVFGASAIKWNFTKFLVSRQGRVVARFAPSTPPKALATKIEDLLAEP